MNGLTLNYAERDYTFVLNNINVELGSRRFEATFDLYLGENKTNKIYTIYRGGDNFDPLMDYNDYPLYYRMLCEELGYDPSIVPNDMTLE